MSLRNILPLAVTTAVGVYSGIYIFGPTFKEEAEEKQGIQTKEFKTQHSASVTSDNNTGSTKSISAPALSSSSPISSTSLLTLQPSAPARDHVRRTEERVANAGGATTIPSDAIRWAEVQAGQFGVAGQTFKWGDVPLGAYSTQGKDQD